MIVDAKLMELSFWIVDPVVEVFDGGHTGEDATDVDKLCPVVIEAPLAFEKDKFF